MSAVSVDKDERIIFCLRTGTRQRIIGRKKKKYTYSTIDVSFI
jgi:hypothetical protein